MDGSKHVSGSMVSSVRVLAASVIAFGLRVVRIVFAWLLPRVITRRAKVLAWASLVTEIIIVGTGGAVRLTASGLGCPTWPLCTPGSLVPTPELGFHAVVEFSNRLMSGVVAVVALFTFLFILRMRKSRPELFWLSLSLGILVLVQAAIGGVTVLTNLEWYIVGIHFILSAIMVILAAMLVWHVFRTGQKHPALPLWLRGLAWATAVLSAITVVVGVLTTGSGPHAGDTETPRNGLSTELLEHLHAWPAYVLLAVTVLIVLLAWRAGYTTTRNLSLWLLGAEFLQVAVGLYQARNGLPALSVGAHMVLSCILLAIATVLVLSTTRARQP